MNLPPGKIVAMLRTVQGQKGLYNVEGNLLMGGELVPVVLCINPGRVSDGAFVLRVRPCPEYDNERALIDPDPIPF